MDFAEYMAGGRLSVAHYSGRARRSNEIAQAGLLRAAAGSGMGPRRAPARAAIPESAYIAPSVCFRRMTAAMPNAFVLDHGVE
jgi:hypothetical protein